MAELEHLGGKRAESARMRRAEQLRRWRGSLTEQEPSERRGAGRQAQSRRGSPRVRFEDGAVFLAACSSGDTDEVKKLLTRGADINTVNVDGLTALHQVSCFSILCVQPPVYQPLAPASGPWSVLVPLPSQPAWTLVPLGWSVSFSASFLPLIKSFFQLQCFYLEELCHPAAQSVFVFPSTYLSCHGYR